jgi:hypothetical protein
LRKSIFPYVFFSETWFYIPKVNVYRHSPYRSSQTGVLGSLRSLQNFKPFAAVRFLSAPASFPSENCKGQQFTLRSTAFVWFSENKGGTGTYQHYRRLPVARRTLQGAVQQYLKNVSVTKKPVVWRIHCGPIA